MDMPRPTDVVGVQPLGGFVNYLAKFLPKISEVMAPMAFEKMEELVTEAPVLRYYDMNKLLVIQCDASEKGAINCRVFV